MGKLVPVVSHPAAVPVIPFFFPPSLVDACQPLIARPDDRVWQSSRSRSRLFPFSLFFASRQEVAQKQDDSIVEVTGNGPGVLPATASRLVCQIWELGWDSGRSSPVSLDCRALCILSRPTRM
jgi:hypothetical protein